MKIDKIMKFGGTSVGNPERMKALIPLITDAEKKIIVLSAMSGTTNALVEITDLLRREALIGVRVDADERPDIADRYTFGGWPTLAVLTPDGAVLSAAPGGSPAEVQRWLGEVLARYAADAARLRQAAAWHLRFNGPTDLTPVTGAGQDDGPLSRDERPTSMSNRFSPVMTGAAERCSRNCDSRVPSGSG